MGKPLFSAIPLRAIGDDRLTDGDLRVLASIAAFDRLSLTRKKGQGAWAAHKTMAAWIGRNYANFSTTVSKLIELDYLVREPRQGDRRQFTYRVIYTDDDRLPSGKDVCPEANDQPAEATEIVCPAPIDPEEIVCPGGASTPHKCADFETEYISQREGIDFGKPSEINSAEAAHFADRETREQGFSSSGDADVGTINHGARATPDKSIDRELGISRRAFACKAPDAQLAMFERAFQAIERDTSALSPDEYFHWGNWLMGLSFSLHGKPLSRRAGRLLVDWDKAPSLFPLDELRDWVAQALRPGRCSDLEYLADAAGIPADVLSQFRNGKILPDGCRESLQHACDRFLPLHEWRAAA